VRARLATHYEAARAAAGSIPSPASAPSRAPTRPCRRADLAGPPRGSRGKGDIKRFFDQVEDHRARFEIARRSFQTGLAALQRLEDLSQTFRTGPFGEGSLFARALRKIEDDRGTGRPGAERMRGGHRPDNRESRATDEHR
jgi:hypothetical protein